MTIARPAKKAAKKKGRLELRLQPAQRRLLEEAARASAMSTSAFVVSHATAAAQRVLADRTHFVLPGDRWEAFVSLLDRDEQPMLGLAAFLARPTVFDGE